MSTASRPHALATGLAVLSALLLIAALFLRGIAAELPTQPRVDPELRPELPEPKQFLRPGGARRFDEFAPFITEANQEVWQRARGLVQGLNHCPPLSEWLNTGAGQEVERGLTELRLGSDEEALAALALILELARRSEWKPGLLAKTEHVEVLGRLLEEWLLARAPEGAVSPLLHEPSLYALVAYGHAMRIAYNAPLIGRNESSRERSRLVLHRLLGPRAAERTTLGRYVQERFPRSVDMLEEKEDILRGFDEEADTLFPELTGECPKD
ncbi:MAG: hypothetical protein AAF368_05035 [Planctomycetota bacterium]